MKGLEKLFMFGMKKQELPPIDGTGVLLFKNNMPDVETTKELTSKLGQKRLIAVDCEGGEIVNVPLDFYPLKPPRYQNYPDDDAFMIARHLKGLGINTNLAPVCDMNSSERSLGEDPWIVGKKIGDIVMSQRAAPIISCAKHFPGLPSKGDSHHEKVYVHSPQLVPFFEAIKAQVHMVMMGHAICPMLDVVPSSRNPNAYHLLREGLGFNGVIITDSLDMRGAGWNLFDNVLKAFESGADILLISSLASSEQQWTAFKTLELVVSQNKRMRKRAKESIRRVDALLSLI